MISRSYKCDFCKYEAGPMGSPNGRCEDCTYGSKFEMKEKPHPMDTREWLIHQKLDEFIEVCGVEFVGPQREYIHRLIDRSRVASYPINYPRGKACVYSLNTLREMVILMMEQKELEKMKKGRKINMVIFDEFCGEDEADGE